ncbi:pannexin-1a isoform X2 [Sinocyclocheilus anshuiensis]|uniref:pannexin-1a isoform X2 n=1 Tax=Sinocyclocheilus anshuiensis TaxID=1608454 RepID=UPI0007B99387|nr:PREDICTED: pannexin-1 isoform X2 [Sinocyclocheilus anshuiensis]
MAIAHAATEYVFADFVLKEPASENRYKGIRLDLALDKMVTCVAVGLPLLLISLAFAQEVSVGTQISCFSPTKFSWRQAAYVDSYCWAAVQTQDTGGLPLWLHKFFPYILLLVAVSVYMPALFWRFTGAPVLSSDLTFIMEELDRSYNRAIKLSKCLYTAGKLDSESARMGSHSSVRDLTESYFKYPLVEQYLKTKRFSRGLLIRYLLCRTITFLALMLACIYLCYYIRLSITDEFQCDIRTGAVINDSSVPPAMQCKLVAVGIFQLLSYINLWVMQFGQVTWDDQALYLLFLEENLSELKSYKCLKVLELLKEGGDDSFDTIQLLQTLGQVKTDVVDGRLPGKDRKISSTNNGDTELKEISPLLQDGGLKNHEDEKVVRQRVI